MKQSNLYFELLNAPCNAPVCITHSLDTEFMLKAYSLGLFPWTTNPVTWWCPDPRAVLFLDEVHKPKSLKKFNKFYQTRLDEKPLELIKLCANTRAKTWIDKTFLKAYEELIEQGFLHSLELYEKDELVGGIYGLIIGKVFFGESMVSLKPNVSKLAMIRLCQLLKPYDFVLDCQVSNTHLEFMGAKNLARKDFLALLETKVNTQSGFSAFKNLQALEHF